MKRNYIFLNPDSVSIKDKLEKLSYNLRSRIIRSIIDKLADKRKSKKKFILDNLAGFIDLKCNKNNNFAQSFDEIYQKV